MSVAFAFFSGTIIPCLPALVALVAWGEAGARLLRQFGARMLWEVSGLVVVGVAILLYAMLTLLPDDGPNILVLIVGATCAVLLVTFATTRCEGWPPLVRAAVTGAVALVGLQGGLGLAVYVYLIAAGART